MDFNFVEKCREIIAAMEKVTGRPINADDVSPTIVEALSLAYSAGRRSVRRCNKEEKREAYEDGFDDGYEAARRDAEAMA